MIESWVKSMPIAKEKFGTFVLLMEKLGIGQLQCVSYDIVCDMFYCLDCKKALINKEDR